MGSLLHANVTNITNMTIGPVDPELIFGPQRDPMYIVLPITIMYSIIFVTGLFGNIFTCLVIIRNKSMHTATNYYLFSLAISDLLLLISGMPQEMYSIWSKWPYVFGQAFCLIRGLAAETSTNASVLTITLFTIERYLAICHPFVSHKMSKLSRATRHVVILWVAALTLALPQALQFGVSNHRGVVMCLQTRVIIEHSFEMSTFFFFFAPMILISVLYSLIGLRLKKSDLSNDVPEELKLKMRFTPKVQRKHSQSTKRVIKMLVAVVVAFFICWAPFHAQRLVAIYGTDEHHRPRSSLLLHAYTTLTYISGVFYYFSTSINPILYHIMSNKFREAFKVEGQIGVRHSPQPIPGSSGNLTHHQELNATFIPTHRSTLVRCCRAGGRSSQRCSYTTAARNPASSSVDSGNNPKDGDKGITRGSKTSLSDKRIKFDFDRNITYYQHKYEQTKLARDINLEEGLKEGGEAEKNKLAEEVYVVFPEDTSDDDTQLAKVTLSDEPEVYIREIRDRIKRRQKGYG